MGTDQASGTVYEFEILFIGHLEDTLLAGKGRDGAEPGIGGGVLPIADSLLDTSKVAIFRCFCQAGSNGIQVDIDHTSSDGGVIEQGLGLKARFPEAAFHIIFSVGGASDKFVDMLHEPAQAAEAIAQLSDALGGIGQGLDLLVKIGGRFSFRAVSIGAEGEPTAGDIGIGPGIGDIGACTEDGVVMVFEDGVVEDIDSEDGGEEAQSIFDPGFTVGEIAAGKRIEAAEESAADTAGEAVIDADGIFRDIVAAWQGHVSPPYKRFNGEGPEVAKKKIKK